jgi:hypothetical protein
VEDVACLYLTAFHPCGFRFIREIRVEVVQPRLQVPAATMQNGEAKASPFTLRVPPR